LLYITICVNFVVLSTIWNLNVLDL
jgi:hypothetical protein